MQVYASCIVVTINRIQRSQKYRVININKLKKELVNQEHSPNSQEDSNDNNAMLEDYEDSNDREFSPSSIPLSSKNSKDKNTNTNTSSSSIEDQLSPTLMTELSRHFYKFTCYNPIN